MIEDAIIISALASAAVYLFFSTKNSRKNRQEGYIIEKWSPGTRQSVDIQSTVSVPESKQSKYIIRNLEQMLSILFPPPNVMRKKFTGLLSALNNRNIMADIKIKEGPKSFTINKREIYLCLKDRKSGEENYYDYNSLIFVTLHEIAHVLCDELGHTKKFQMIFNELLEHASSLGLYDKHKPFVKDYCMY
jgi:hypothetical protein